MKVSEGDENAFNLLFKAYYNQLGEFIMRMTESGPLTQEIVQDVFMQIWTSRSSLGSINCFRAYLMVVGRNHTFNCLKKIARERSRQKQWVDTVLQHAVNSVEGNEGNDRGSLIDEAVELLPLQQKKVYTLSRIDGVRQQQIASELNISHQTVKKHLVLALRFLKNHLRSHIGLMIFMLLF